jgi:mannose/fructose-specific phosphotransferase system component IIA
VTRAVIVTHGNLGAALMEVVSQTLGPQSDVEIITNEGRALDQITRDVEARLTGAPVLLFVDSCGGSPFVACKCLCAQRENVAIISGVNLPMLISFFTKRHQYPFDELRHIVESDGHRGIQLAFA